MNLLTNENILIDTRPPGQKAIEKIANTVKSLTTEPRSTSNVVTQSYTFDPETRALYYTNGLAGYIIPLWSNQSEEMVKSANGFPNPFSGEILPYFVGLQNPNLLKVSNVSEVSLTASLSYYDRPFVGGTSNASSSYSVKFYISAWLYELNNTPSWLQELTYLEATFTYNPSNFTFTITPGEFNRSLSNISSLFSEDSGIITQNFTANPTGILQTNFDKLSSQSNQVLFMMGFDKTDVAGLSGYDIGSATSPWISNKAHFKESFIGDFTNVSPYRKLLVSLNFNYFGLLTPYAKQS